MKGSLGDLSGRCALVTGSTRGIGRALAIGLAKQCAAIAVHGSGPASPDSDTVRAIRDAGGTAEYFEADLRDADATRQLARDVEAVLGKVDILVLNASYEARADWRAIDVEAIDRHWAINFRSSLLLCQSLAPQMESRGWGRIIGIGSIQEAKPNPALAAYAATKSAQANLIRMLARELGPAGVTANNLAPGAIATDRNAAALQDATYRARVTSQIPARRIGSPDECVGACIMLASDAGAYINGTTLFVDGGWHI